MQDLFDSFELRIPRKLRSWQTPNVSAIQAEIANINGMVVELFERPVIIETIIGTMIPTVKVPNI